MFEENQRFNEILAEKKTRKVNPYRFGCDKRFSQTKVTKPGPGSYENPTIFDIRKFKQQGVKVGTGKSHPHILNTPGVGSYNIAASLSAQSQLCTLPREKRTKSIVKDGKPAPNSYDQSIKLYNSKYKKCRTTMIGPKNSDSDIFNENQLITMDFWKKRAQALLSD